MLDIFQIDKQYLIIQIFESVPSYCEYALRCMNGKVD